MKRRFAFTSLVTFLCLLAAGVPAADKQDPLSPQIARLSDGCERRRRAKIDHNAIRAEPGISRNSICDQVTAHTVGIVRLNHDPGVDACADHYGPGARLLRDHLTQSRRQLRHDAADDSLFKLPQLKPGFCEEMAKHHGIFVWHSLAHGLYSPGMRPTAAIMYAKHDVGIADIDSQ